jgi:hypothetical protein
LQLYFSEEKQFCDSTFVFAGGMEGVQFSQFWIVFHGFYHWFGSTVLREDSFLSGVSKRSLAVPK